MPFHIPTGKSTRSRSTKTAMKRPASASPITRQKPCIHLKAECTVFVWDDRQTFCNTFSGTRPTCVLSFFLSCNSGIGLGAVSKR